VNVNQPVDLCPHCNRPVHTGEPCAPPSTSRPSSEAIRRPLTALGLGMQVGDYRVEEKIGAGGMGSVYRAVHSKNGKVVAIKVLSGMHARDANSVRRFILEIRAVNEIHHPNLVDIFSFGQLTDGRYYYVMEFLEGCSLGALMRARGILRPAEILEVFVDVLKALQAAHAKGIVHRDLKPDNVFLVDVRAGQPLRAKLLDFGLAKLVSDPAPAVPLTAAGMAVGTPQYMAPEQCKARKVDGRADLYALGVMLYEAVTGKLPCDGRSTLEIWEAHVRRIPRRPTELAPDISPELESIIMTLLAKSPEERFSSADAVIAALTGEASRLPSASANLSDAILSGASASDVARAIPSSIRTADVIPLGGGGDVITPSLGPPAKVTADVLTNIHRALEPEGLRAVLDPDLEIVEPVKSRNPKQVSVLDIDLGVLKRDAPPAWAAAASATRLQKARTIRPPPPARGNNTLKLVVLFGLALVAAIVVVIAAR
jgi:serine/threonine protein kinase